MHCIATLGVMEVKRDSFSDIANYLSHGTYPAGADEATKSSLRKRSKFFTMERGHLHYVGGKVKKNPTLVIQSVDEQQRLIKTIHDTAHLGRDKALSQLTKRYCWPDMYKVCQYVSRYKLGCDYIVFILVNGRYDRVISVSDRTRRI